MAGSHSNGDDLVNAGQGAKILRCDERDEGDASQRAVPGTGSSRRMLTQIRGWLVTGNAVIDGTDHFSGLLTREMRSMLQSPAFASIAIN